MPVTAKLDFQQPLLQDCTDNKLRLAWVHLFREHSVFAISFDSANSTDITYKPLAYIFASMQIKRVICPFKQAKQFMEIMFQ